MNNHTPEIDIVAIHNLAKQRWLSQHRRTYSLLDYVERSVPWWLVLIAAVLFGLSAPHTATIFGQLTPTFGWFAPLGVEFGLLYAAFRRKRSKQTRDRVPNTVWALEILLFITAIIVNGAGSLIAVVSTVGLRNMPLSDILHSFGTFPAITQVALALVPLAAFIIPIGTGVAGEGLAALVFERDRSKNELEEAWRLVEREEVRRALYAILVHEMSIMEARKQAEMMSAGLSGAPLRTPRLGRTDDIKLIPEKASRATARVRQSVPDARTKVRKYLNDNPDAVSMTVRELASTVGVGKSIAAEELARWKQEHS